MSWQPPQDFYGGGGFFQDGPFFFTEDAGSSSSGALGDDMPTLLGLLDALHNPHLKDRALSQLAKSKLVREEYAPLLWHADGVITLLLFVSVYNLVIKLLTSIPTYLYPYIENKRVGKAHEYLRLTSLGVIGALVKVDDPRTTKYLLETEVFPSCLYCMEYGNNLLSKTVAIFIVNRLMESEEGLKYCCALADRFFAVSHQLGRMLEVLTDKEQILISGADTARRLLKHIICCYQRLSESPRGCNGLRVVFPMRLRDTGFLSILQNDATGLLNLQKLFHNIGTSGIPPPISPNIEALVSRMALH
ncbi:CCR4-NOT transcription complex subunit 9 [Linum perenne]